MENTLEDLAADTRVLALETSGEPWSTTCAHCGRSALNSSGFLYRGGDAFAVYQATLHGHADRPEVDLGIGIGRWAEDDASADVSAFISVWATVDEIQFGFVNPDESVWGGSSLLANPLAADAARDSAIRSSMIEIAELVVREDPALARHLV
jgi:hypothetical protein